MNYMVNEICIHYLYYKADSDVSTTDKFSYKKWEIWKEKVSNWIKTKRIVTNLPLSYIIWKYTTPLTIYHSELIVYNVSLNSSVFNAYRRKVGNLLAPLVLNTDAFAWGGRKFTHIKVRKGWLELASNCNVSGYESCIDTSRQKLSNLFYKNEMTFNFDTFSTNMKATFDTMEKYGEGRAEWDKVSTFLENIRTTDQKL